MSRDPIVQLDRHYRDKRGVVVHVIGYDRLKQEVSLCALGMSMNACCLCGR
ncbi:Uncharacterised protein [Serratia liquefaciens]|nr:hypothetical protein SFB10_3740 [Serratia liquefaciens]CAI1096742.1 Uncharacterised protein [Serratia liquefaciens]SUI44029.1 Uncharacterised protein [Serratia liquefaciens]